MAAATEASSSNTSRFKYRVFLSFRGPDTRTNFTDHLYTALEQEGIHTFRDDDEIPRGGNIDSEIQRAIEESEASIIVISEGYASSRSCLNELVMILDRRRDFGHFVLPVFYRLDPSEAAEQTGSFGEAFGVHEKEFRNEIQRVDRWRAALREVAGQVAGIVVRNGYEAKFIKDILREVRDKVNCMPLHVPPFHVGLEFHLEKIDAWLHQDASSDAGIGIIYGIGGVGKSTIAKLVYNQNFKFFESTSFLNVRDTLEEPNGLVKLQRNLLSNILKGKGSKIYTVAEGVTKIKEAICCRRVLIVLDDVDDSDHFESIIGMQDWIYKGSKILVTTRRESLLRAEDNCVKFKIMPLHQDESLKLFSWHAFGQTHPVKDKIEFSERVLRYCEGLPLALEVIGSALSRKSKEVWGNALQEMEAISNRKIQKVLRISFNSLDNEYHKIWFLDIVCFFVGMDKDYVVKILDGSYGINPTYGIENLMDRLLVNVNECNKLMMHPLLIDMGRDIVCEESFDDIGKRSRLWCHCDAFTVLKEEAGSEVVRGLNLNIQMLFGRCKNSEQYLKVKGFAKMGKLKLLHLSYVKVVGDYGDFPKSLIWLRWNGFSLKSLPNNLCLEKLVVLDMPNSNLSIVWKGKKSLPMLRILDLSHSHCLVTTPDLSGVGNLERLILTNCIKLVEIHLSIGALEQLVLLNLKGCTDLRFLPREIGKLKSLEELDLSGCTDLRALPNEIGKLNSLKQFDLSSCLELGELPMELKRVKLSRLFGIHGIKTMVSRNTSSTFLTGVISKFPYSLVKLSLGDCNIKDSYFPTDLSLFPFLSELDLRGNPIQGLPESIKKVSTLKRLTLFGCEKLQVLPELPTSVDVLNLTRCSSLKRIANLPNFYRSLTWFLDGCKEIVEVQDMFKLESVTKDDIKLISQVGMFNLDFVEAFQINMYNRLARRAKTTPLQILHECGIFSIFLPGSDIPNWYDHKNDFYSLSFEVPLVYGHKVSGLNLCVVYTNDDTTPSTKADYQKVIKHPKLEFGLPVCPNLLVRITNETKNIKWAYSPVFVGVPKGNEDMLWLSHFKFGDEQMNTGDQMDILVSTTHYFQIERIGVHLVYVEEEELSNASHDLLRVLSDLYVWIEGWRV